MEQARDQAFQRVPGTNAFDLYQKQQDARYTRMKHYAAAWGTDNNSINFVYGTIKYCEKRVRDYQDQARALEAQGQNVDWEALKKSATVCRTDRTGP